MLTTWSTVGNFSRSTLNSASGFFVSAYQMSRASSMDSVGTAMGSELIWNRREISSCSLMAG